MSAPSNLAGRLMRRAERPTLAGVPKAGMPGVLVQTTSSFTRIASSSPQSTSSSSPSSYLLAIVPAQQSD